MKPVEIFAGDSPVILGVPHAGTFIPDDIRARLNDTGLAIADTDWHVDRLYSNLLPGATMVCATFHRYVIDANRDPEGISLYPGQNTTSLCPVTDFDGRPIYLEGEEPSPDEIEQRAERGWTERDARARKGVGMYVGAGLGVCDSTGPARARDVAGREGARGERRSARARRRGAARRWRAPSQSRARERESGRGPR